jgi:N-methylhydantoinase B
LSIRLPGAGGYGPPTERDPEIVRWDVLNGKVSPESARADYGVVLNGDLTVNHDETKGLRKKAGFLCTDIVHASD